jgi:hypothetical protein
MARRQIYFFWHAIKCNIKQDFEGRWTWWASWWWVNQEIKIVKQKESVVGRVSKWIRELVGSFKV